ncbi:TCP-1/cpn60 chaperonin family protein [Tanacetum coccineum]
MVAALNAPASCERKYHYLDDIAILTGGSYHSILHVRNEPCYGFLGTMVREDVGFTLERVQEDMLGCASYS